MESALHILLVEDNPIDVRVTVRAADKLTTSHTMQVANDGDQAINYLSDPAQQKPHMVLLDLNLPGRDGNDVLAFIKSHSQLRRIPVIVLTTSGNEVDVANAYELGANAYVNKPNDLAGWQTLLEQIEGFWFSAVRFST